MDIKWIVIGNVLLGLLQIGLGLPLLLRKVPKNSFYGIRTAAAFESEQRWYDINAYAGRQMLIWAFIMISNGATGFFIPASTSASSAYLAISLALAGVTAAAPALMAVIWSRKSPATK